jgi:hypothetical protein
MPDHNAPSDPYQPVPFVPGIFYVVPHQWLADVRETGDLDTRQLLLAMNNGTDNLVVFAPERNEAYWTRANPEGLPNVVSHPTYLRYLRALIAGGKLRAANDASAPSQVYILAGWPHFDPTGKLYVPRAYIQRRWPAWLGQGQWAPRAALLTLLDRLAVDETGVPSPTGQPLAVNAYVRELRQRAQVLLPAADIADKVGTGLTMLADLGLITETARSRFNRGYCLRTDAFERLPVWPLAEIATRCGLDLAQDEPWVALIQAFLRHNFWPVTRSFEVWGVIRRYVPDAVTHDAAEGIGRLLAQRAARPRGSRAATSPSTVLKDYAAQQRRPWLYGPTFKLALVSGAASEPGLWLPTSSPANLDATQLMVSPTCGPRLNAEDAVALLRGTRWFIRQPTARYVEQLIELPLPLRPDRRALSDGLFLDGNHLHTALNFSLPFRVMLEPAQENARLTLTCQFRALPGRTAAVIRQGAQQPRSLPPAFGSSVPANVSLA